LIYFGPKPNIFIVVIVVKSFFLPNAAFILPSFFLLLSLVLVSEAIPKSPSDGLIGSYFLH